MSEPTIPPTDIFDINRGFRLWHINEIYVPGGPVQRVYVPNVGDLIIDYGQGFFTVSAVDYTTGESTRVKWAPPPESGTVSGLDILLASGPGEPSDSFRVYIDTSVFPHTLAFDSRLHLKGSEGRYVKLFKGTDTSQATGEVISRFYDQSGTFLGDNIPLELVTMPDVNNIAIKTPRVGYTTQALSDNEVVTAVLYTDTGGVRSINTLIVKNTAFMRTTDAGAKYVQSVSIETPFLSNADPKLIQFPINMPVQNLNLMGVVTYSDGSKLKMAIDGTKFSVYGLENYISSVQGQRLPVVVTYQLSPGEYVYDSQPSLERHVSENYTATTLQADGSYSVKLFVYPVWVDQLNGYRLDYYLYNLNREEVYNVTSLVQTASGSRAFNPTEYGVLQRITVAVNLNQVDSKFAAYRHVQTVEVTLLTEGTLNNQDNWTVGFSPGQNPHYGVGVEAIAQFINVNNWQLNITCGESTLQNWLEKVYYPTQPLIDPDSEILPPEPNFFVLVSGNTRTEYPIAQWGSLLTVTAVPNEGRNIYLEFLRRGAVTDLQLGKTGMVVHYAGS